MESENDLPDLVETTFFLIITVILVKAILKFRMISNRQSGLQESKIAITLHLSLFLSVSSTLVAYLMFEAIYLATSDDIYHEIVTFIRVIV
jgi:hypothetical protein